MHTMTGVGVVLRSTPRLVKVPYRRLDLAGPSRACICPDGDKRISKHIRPQQLGAHGVAEVPHVHADRFRLDRRPVLVPSTGEGGCEKNVIRGKEKKINEGTRTR